MTADHAKLRQIFEEERVKLNLPQIEPVFLSPPPLDYYQSLSHWRLLFDDFSTKAIKEDDGSYRVQFNPLSFKTEARFRRRAKHELYHIHRDLIRPRDRVKFFRYMFIEEPSAMLYSHLGVRT